MKFILALFFTFLSLQVTSYSCSRTYGDFTLELSSDDKYRATTVIAEDRKFIGLRAMSDEEIEAAPKPIHSCFGLSKGINLALYKSEEGRKASKSCMKLFQLFLVSSKPLRFSIKGHEVESKETANYVPTCSLSYEK